MRQDELRETVKSLRHRVKNMQKQNNRLELMLGAILKHHNISVDYEVDDNVEWETFSNEFLDDRVTMFRLFCRALIAALKLVIISHPARKKLWKDN